MSEPGASVSHIDAEEWEYDEETGGLVHMLYSSATVEVGLWKPGPVAHAEIVVELEANETLLVLAGSGSIEIDGASQLALHVGDTVSMPKGTHTKWVVDEDSASGSTRLRLRARPTTYYGVVNGNGAWGPAHDLNSNAVLIPVSFGVETDTFTDPDGNVSTSTNPPRAKGSSAPKGATPINCSYTVGPVTFPDGSSFAISGTVTGFVTPARG